MSNNENADLLAVMNQQLRYTPFDHELSDFAFEVVINATPLYEGIQHE